MDKPILAYKVREQSDPTMPSLKILVPAIVDRAQTVSLANIVEGAIDRGLIAGLKPSAAKGIAEGVANEMYHQFQLGNGIAFGKYFYGRPYLDGTVDVDGRITPERNKINIRLYKGADFRLSVEDFSFRNVDEVPVPEIDNIATVGATVADTLAKDQPFNVYGKNFDWTPGYEVIARWTRTDEESEATAALTAQDGSDAFHGVFNAAAAWADLPSGWEITLTYKNTGGLTATRKAVIA